MRSGGDFKVDPSQRMASWRRWSIAWLRVLGESDMARILTQSGRS